MKKRYFLLFSLLVVSMSAAFAQELHKDLRSFKKIVVSPHINLVLEKGTREHIRVVYSQVNAEKINIDVTGKTLHLYLDNARIVEKSDYMDWNTKRGSYHGATVTAYVTYQDLEYLEIRGDRGLTCLDPLSAKTFTLKAYGENKITLASVRTGYLRVLLYGENKLEIDGGRAEYQKYNLFGENRIDTRGLKSDFATANIYGVSKLKLTTEDELRVNAFGDSHVMYNGDPEVAKRLVIGNSLITRLD